MSKRKPQAAAVYVVVSDVAMTVTLGRALSMPLSWYPRLMHATPAEKNHWKLIGDGIHWPDLDEDLSVEGMLAGRPSMESKASLENWLRQYQKKSVGRV